MINRELTMTLMRLIVIKHLNRLTALIFISIHHCADKQRAPLSCPQVEVQGSVSSNVVVISLNQAANVVENKIPEVERYITSNQLSFHIDMEMCIHRIKRNNMDG